MSIRNQMAQVRRRFVTALLLPVLLAGCEDILGPSADGIILAPVEVTWLSEPASIEPATHPPEDPPPGEVMVDSIFYRAEVLAPDTALGAEPMSLTVRLRQRNPFDDPVTIEVPSCSLTVMAYASMDRMDPPIWSVDLGDLGVECPARTGSVTVPAQGDFTADFVVLPQFLGRKPGTRYPEGPPDGRYYFSMEVRRVDKEPILLLAGSGDVRLQEPGLEFDVHLEERGGNVHVDLLRVTNRNDVPIPLVWGGCSLQLEVYHDAARTSLAKKFPGPICFDVGRSEILGPGETIPVDRVLEEFYPAGGDLDLPGVLDLPRGRYFLSARLRLNYFDYNIPAGEILLW